MINYKKTVLPNGLRVITVPIKETKAVTVLFLIDAGSRYESREKSGIFHFMEHMFFKGTKKRPSALDISRQLDSIGADFNAFTSDEYTGFYVSSASSHFDLSLDILSDIIINSQFPNKEMKNEKNVIIEEINMYQDLPQKHVLDLMKLQLFGDTPLGWQTLGNPESVTNIERQDFLEAKNNYYHPENIIVVVAGATDKFNWKQSIAKKLSKMKSRKKISCQNNNILQNKPNLLVKYKKTDQAHLIIGFKSFSRFDNRRYALRILNNILGATMSSRLFTEVREKKGLAYYIGSSIWEFSDTGAQISYAGSDIKRIDDTLKIILNEYQKLIKNKVTKEELTRTKENLKGKMHLGLEDSFSIADFIGGQELLFNEIEQPEAIIKKLTAITTKNILDIASELFQPKNLNIAIIGPFKDKKQVDKIIKKW